MLSNEDFKLYQEIFANHTKQQNNNPEIENYIKKQLEFFLYSELKKYIQEINYSCSIELSEGTTAKVSTANGIINIVVKKQNGEVFNGVWSNLPYNKILEMAPMIVNHQK